MKQGIRLVLVLVTMMLPCTGYSGDDRYDAYLPLAELALMQMFKTFIGGGAPPEAFSILKRFHYGHLTGITIHLTDFWELTSRLLMVS